MHISLGSIAQPGAPFGYGIIGDNLFKAIHNAGAFISVQEPEYDLAIAIGLPMPWAVSPGTRRTDLVWHTMFEATPFPPGWPGVINRSAGVWVPCQWSAQEMRKVGVTTPIMISGYGVDTDIFSYAPRNPDAPFRVVTWGRGLNSRKNLPLAMRVFAAANLPDDAFMEVKVNTDDPLAFDGQTVEGSNIRIIKQIWPVRGLADWLRSASAMVYMSSGEGFGLMPLEAMATGLPVICAANTGMLEYLTPQNSLMVECPNLIPAHAYTRMFGYDCEWYQPDFDQAVEYLRWAYYNREAAFELGRQAALDVAANWTWEIAGQSALRKLHLHFQPNSRTYNSDNVTATLPLLHFTEV